MLVSNGRFWAGFAVGVLTVAVVIGARKLWLAPVALLGPVAAPGEEEASPPAEGLPADSERYVQLASPELASKIGIETAPVQFERHAHYLDANAETAYNAQRTADVLARVSGVVQEVRVELNQSVSRGDVLAVIDSAAVGTAKAQFLTALATVKLAEATHDRYRALAEKQIAAGKNEIESLTALTQARASLLEAQQHLFNFGFTKSDLDRTEREESASNLLSVIAPIGGSVKSWDAALGEAVEPNTHLFGLSDISSLWLWIDVYEADIAQVKVGQPVTFTVSGASEPAYLGQITAIGTEADRTTRTTRIRAQIGNADGRLRANVFGTARIMLAAEREVLVIPSEAIQHDGRQDIVFLPEGPARYRRQAVIAKATDDVGKSEIVEGLEPGQQVVTTGGFLLFSELVKDRIAGDVD